VFEPLWVQPINMSNFQNSREDGGAQSYEGRGGYEEVICEERGARQKKKRISLESKRREDREQHADEVRVKRQRLENS